MSGYTFGDFEVIFKSPEENLSDINLSLKEAWGCLEPIHMTIAIPTQKTLRKVHHFKGRRYVVRYSMFDVFKGWFK